MVCADGAAWPRLGAVFWCRAVVQRAAEVRGCVQGTLLPPPPAPGGRRSPLFPGKQPPRLHPPLPAACIMLQKSAFNRLIIRAKQGEILCKCQTRLPRPLQQAGIRDRGDAGSWGGAPRCPWAAVLCGPRPGLGEQCANQGGLGRDTGLGVGPASGALDPLRGPGDGHGGAQRCLRAPSCAGGAAPLRACVLLCFCMAPYLISSGTRGSDKSPPRHSGEMLRLHRGRWGGSSVVGGGSEPARCGHAAARWGCSGNGIGGSQGRRLPPTAPFLLPLGKLPVRTAAGLPQILLRLGPGLRYSHEGRGQPFPSCSSGRSVGPAAHAALCPGSARLWG